MPIKTTCIGAYPKSDFIQSSDWFNIPARPDTAGPTKDWAAALAVLEQGVSQVVSDQVNAGTDVPTDVELPQENYIHYHYRRRLSGGCPLPQRFIFAGIISGNDRDPRAKWLLRKAVLTK